MFFGVSNTCEKVKDPKIKNFKNHLLKSTTNEITT